MSVWELFTKSHVNNWKVLITSFPYENVFTILFCKSLRIFRFVLGFSNILEYVRNWFIFLFYWFISLISSSNWCASSNVCIISPKYVMCQYFAFSRYLLFRLCNKNINITTWYIFFWSITCSVKTYYHIKHFRGYFIGYQVATLFGFVPNICHKIPTLLNDTPVSAITKVYIRCSNFYCLIILSSDHMIVGRTFQYSHWAEHCYYYALCCCLLNLVL